MRPLAVIPRPTWTSKYIIIATGPFNLSNLILLPVCPSLRLFLFFLLTDSEYWTKQLICSPKIDKSSGPNKGAIAGGVVGGVCGAIIILGLVWFLLRRRSRSKVSNNAPGGSVATTSDTPSLSKYGHQPFEIEGGNKPMGELYDPASMQTELEANKQARHELSSNIPKKVRQGPPSELPWCICLEQTVYHGIKRLLLELSWPIVWGLEPKLIL